MTDAVTPTPIPLHVTALPDPSDRGTFTTRGLALFEYETGTMVPGMNTLAGQTLTNATAAVEAAEMAYLNANYKGAWSSLTGALNTPAVVSHAGSRWNLLNNIANVAASTPGVSADWELYTSIAAASVEFNPAGTVLSATQVQAAIVELSGYTVTQLADVASDANLQAVAGRNLIRNRNMLEVNRSRTWSYPQAISAGAFVQDAWRSGASGCTVTAQGRGITINAGTIVQTVFTGSVFGSTDTVPANTPVTIEWNGPLMARVNGGAYSASPLVYTPATMPTSFEVEFEGAVGFSSKLSKVRAHIGTFCPPWVAAGDIEAQREADYDYQEVLINHRFDAVAASGELGITYPLPLRVRAGSTAAWGTATANTNVAGTPLLTLVNTRRALAISTTSTTSGAVQYTNTVIVSSGA